MDLNQMLAMAVPVGWAPKLEESEDTMWLKDYLEETWESRWRQVHGPRASGETLNYHETRNPYKQTSDYTSVTLAATSKSIMVVTTDLYASGLRTGEGYWDLGKKWHVRLYGKATTALTPGNLTVEIRHQTGSTVSDAGGTILATSVATALAASKTAANWFMDFTVEARSMVGTAAGLFAKGFITCDPTFGLWATGVNPIFVPSNAAAAVNVDTTLASTINVQWKRSGSTAETVQGQDVQVNSIT